MSWLNGMSAAEKASDRGRACAERLLADLRGRKLIGDAVAEMDRAGRTFLVIDAFADIIGGEIYKAAGEAAREATAKERALALPAPPEVSK